MSTEIVDAPHQQPTDLVVHQGADLVPARNTSSLVQLTAPMEDIVEAQAQYQQVCRALLDENDIQMIGKREFKKKSAWRKLGVAFGVSTQILSTTHERNERGRIIRTEVVARATAPNGRFAEGIGACDLYERCCDADTCKTPLTWPDGNFRHAHCSEWPCRNVHFSNPQHDIPATAATRATNRAAADLFGMGEVSAEEMTDRGDTATSDSSGGQSSATRESKPITDKQIGFLNSLLGQTGVDLFELTDIVGREIVAAPDLSTVEAKKAIDHLLLVKDGKVERPAPPERRSTAEPLPWSELGYPSEDAFVAGVETLKLAWEQVTEDHIREQLKSWLKERGYSNRWPVNATDMRGYLDALKIAAELCDIHEEQAS